MVSGTVALLLQKRPTLTPDNVKALLKTTATPLVKTIAGTAGLGELNLAAALTAATPTTGQALGAVHRHGVGQPVTGQHVRLSRQRQTHRREQHLRQDGHQHLGHPDRCRHHLAGRQMAQLADGRRRLDRHLLGHPHLGRHHLAGVDWGKNTWVDATWSANSWTSGGWSGHYWSGHYWSGDTWSTGYWK